jgi:hypothetical protein
LEKLLRMRLLYDLLLIVFSCKIDYEATLFQIAPYQVEIADVNHDRTLVRRSPCGVL